MTFGLFACNKSTDKKSADKETTKDSLVIVDSSYNDKKEATANEHNCDFDKFLKDPNTPKFAKDLLNNTAKYPGDNEPLTYFDNFKSKDKQEREFYFKVVTNSYKIADGAYSEGLGNTGKEFMENNPMEFAAFFDNKNCFTDIDLATWADIVILEFGIIGEGDYDKPIIDDYINKLKSNCSDCSTTQKETINKFGVTLNKKWKEFLQNID